MKPLPILTALVFLTLTVSAAAQAPTVELSHLRLHDGFTLVYQVTVRDVRTPALREKDVTDQQARPIERFTITLSARDGKLLYLSTRPARYKKDGTQDVIVLDGDKEYEAVGATAADINSDGGRNASIYADENVDRLAFCPLPGMGLPGVDLIQSPWMRKSMAGHTVYSGLVPRLNVLNGETPYNAGSVDTVRDEGRLKVLEMTVGRYETPQQRWQLNEFQLFQDQWLATQMRWTEYEASLAEDGEKLTSDLPTAVADYQLAEARASALDASAFEVGTYLRDKARVFDGAGSRALTFTYDKNGGTLKEQAEAARKKESQKN